MYHLATCLSALVYSGGLLFCMNLQASQGGGLTADNSLGSVVTQQDDTFIISEGTQRGTNLLHSFSDFNLETDQIADFRAAANTQHIIGRVTGPNNSWIDGTLQSTSSEANLYLVNPNGFVFGEHAALDVNGSFYTNTANYIIFEDNQTFYVDPSRGVTMSVAAPESFGFLDGAAHQVQFDSSQLQMVPGKTLSIIGGGVNINNTVLETEGGHIDLVAVASGEVIPIKPQEGIAMTAAIRGNITIKDSDIIVDNQNDSQSVGNIHMLAHQVIVENSDLLADNNSAIDALGNQVSIEASGDIQFHGPAQISVIIKGTGQGGAVYLHAADIQLMQDTKLDTSTIGPGQGGSVIIRADNLSMATSSIASESRFTGAGGSAGQVQIDLTDGLRISGGSWISTSTAGQGHAGDILIGERSKPKVLWMTDKSTILAGSTSTQDKAGQAGNLKILTSEAVHLQGASFFTIASKNAGGGSIQIETRDLFRLQDSKITTSVEGGDGQGGNIFIDPTFIILENSQIRANTHAGDGGNIRLVANYLLISGPTTIQASSDLSTSGNIEVQAVNVDVASLQVAHDVEPLDVAQWQPIPCRQRQSGVSRLVVAGYDAHPTAVDDILSSIPIWAQMSLGTWDDYPKYKVSAPLASPQLIAQAANAPQHHKAIINNVLAAYSGCHL